MLRATTKEGLYLISFELVNKSKDELNSIRKNKLFCTCCNEEVLLKAGLKQIWHFAHKKNSNCSYISESQEHLATKISIYENLKKISEFNNDITNIETEKTKNLKKDKVEEFYNKIKNAYSEELLANDFVKELINRSTFRPDIFFKYKNTNIAIEIQKTKLPEEDFWLRTLFYKLLNIHVLWVIPEITIREKIKKCEISNIEYTMLANFHREVKKFYFGYIYTWNHETNRLSLYKYEKIKGYKKKSIIIKRYSQKSLIFNFKAADIKSSNIHKYSAKTWLLDKYLP